MKLIGLYKPHLAISRVYCGACFTFLKLNNKFVGYLSVETTAVPGLQNCHFCSDNQGPTQYQIESFLEAQKNEKRYSER
jgi:hypothetical protein